MHPLITIQSARCTRARETRAISDGGTSPTPNFRFRGDHVAGADDVRSKVLCRLNDAGGGDGASCDASGKPASPRVFRPVRWPWRGGELGLPKDDNTPILIAALVTTTHSANPPNLCRSRAFTKWLSCGSRRWANFSSPAGRVISIRLVETRRRRWI